MYDILIGSKKYHIRRSPRRSGCVIKGQVMYLVRSRMRLDIGPVITESYL